MADKTSKKPDKKHQDAPSSKAVPTFDPKPVSVGGESLIDRVYPHRMKIGIFIGTGLVIWAVIALIIHFRDSKREKVTDKLAVVIDVSDRRIQDPSIPVDPNDPLKDKEPPFADAKARANAILDALAKQGPDVAGPTYRASILMQAGKLDEAITEYKRAVTSKGIEGVLAREGLGLAEEMKAETPGLDAAARNKGLEDALATFQTMQPDEQGPRRAFALYHQGRMLRSARQDRRGQDRAREGQGAR